ncbi:hypothetical protein [Paenibacillus chibensis]|uniref:GNAT family N-acetyltransferase n=1 Tax=Paenibacillus chibensis TaxID=59846 RepID=UPI002E23B2C4
MTNLNIRTEQPEDIEKVAELLYLAFGDREDESVLVRNIRVSAGFIPELSVVAELNGDIIGHILPEQSRGHKRRGTA